MAKSGNSTEVTPKMHTYIAALLAGNNHQVAATVAGVAHRTADRWLTLPHFQQAYRTAQRQVFDQALTGLMMRVEKAIDTLDRNMDGEDTPASTQVRAAQIVIEQSIAVYKASELEQKIQEFEQMFKQQGV